MGCGINRGRTYPTPPALMIETLQYRLHMLLNLTVSVDTKLNDRTYATAQFAIQNRMAIDMSLASTGGVCAMVGPTCCTYIPNNSSESIEDSLQSLLLAEKGGL
uniref:Uncharacterized protein n=1 Tax=Gouania willdenowi TaxID=441366 RepID=A0A8C5HUD4_GOUWI